MRPVERTVASIIVGDRHRKDMGDLGPLMESIRTLGLLQPITVDPEGHLLVGARRLAAIKALGWRTTFVYVRAISGRLGALMAEYDDNTTRVPLNDIEAASLYREIKTLLAEQASARQEATRFATGTGRNPRSAGGGSSPAPWNTQPGDTREQAARMVTGRESYQTFERVNRLELLAADATQPKHVRVRAVEELARIEAGGSVNASHQRMNAELALANLNTLAGNTNLPARSRNRARSQAAVVRSAMDSDMKPTALARLAREAVATAKGGRPRKPVDDFGGPTLYPLKSFIALWGGLANWWTHYDPAYIGKHLSEHDWQQFLTTVAETKRFLEEAQAARDAMHNEQAARRTPVAATG
jgi:ParB family chromosome partitioning protein